MVDRLRLIREGFSNLLPALVVTRREVRDQFRDWRIIFPVVALTLLFPGLMNFTAKQAVEFVGKYGATVIADRLIPFLLMIVGFFPISVSLVIALDSFVGEKERHSIEPLLTSPLTDVQLYLGKLLAAMAPPLFASYLGIGVYLLAISRSVGWQGTPELFVQILLLTTVQAIVMVSGAVVVSAQTTSTRAANLLASFIIIPMALIVQGESIIMFWARYSTLWWVILAMLIIAGLLIRTGLAQFNREELLGRELDSINLRWIWQVYVKRLVGRARSPLAWLWHEAGRAVRMGLLPTLFMAVAMALGFWAGASQAEVFVIPASLVNVDQLGQGFIQGLESMRFFTASGVIGVWLHNLQVVLLASLLGIFSFGVLGIIVMMLPMMIIGYFMASMAHLGMSPAVFLGGLVLPHGIIEIPALILAGAAILRMGATLATPARGRSLGEAWLGSLADWTKVVLGVVAPLLLAAAFIEVFITPHIAVWLFGR